MTFSESICESPESAYGGRANGKSILAWRWKLFGCRILMVKSRLWCACVGTCLQLVECVVGVRTWDQNRHSNCRAR